MGEGIMDKRIVILGGGESGVGGELGPRGGQGPPGHEVDGAAVG